ncbi:MAG: YheU family protein [Pseudomonadota bacterium]
MIKVPLESLSPEAVLGVIDDFVLREGTDYGAEEASLDAKRAVVRRQLETGVAEIWFDPESDSVTLRLRD